MTDDLLGLAIEKGAFDVAETLVSRLDAADKAVSFKKFSDAMVKAKKSIPDVVKTKLVRFNSTSYKHAELSQIVAVITPWLAENGFFHSWSVRQNDSVISVTCVLSHVDGHREETTVTSPHDKSGAKNAIQAVGSAITYLQRYTLLAATGLAAGNDDDGAATADSKPVYHAGNRLEGNVTVEAKTIDGLQCHKLDQLIKSTGTDIHDVLGHYGIESLKDLPVSEYQKCFNALTKKLTKQGA